MPRVCRDDPDVNFRQIQSFYHPNQPTTASRQLADVGKAAANDDHFDHVANNATACMHVNISKVAGKFVFKDVNYEMSQNCKLH